MTKNILATSVIGQKIQVLVQKLKKLNFKYN